MTKDLKFRSLPNLAKIHARRRKARVHNSTNKVQQGASGISKSGGGGGCKLAIFRYSELKFDMALYFGLINSQTVAKRFGCKNGF